MGFQQTYEQKRQLLRQELQQKEDDMRQQFVIRVKEKETELKEAEKEVMLKLCSIILCSLNHVPYLTYLQLQSRFDRLKKEHAEEKRKLDEAKKKLEEDQTELAKRRQQMLTQSTGTLGSGHHTLTLGKHKKK